MKRLLFVLLTVAVPLYAGDEPKPEENRAQKIREITEKMQNAAPAERAELLKELQKLLQDAKNGGGGGFGGFGSGITIVAGPNEEKMSGTWEDENGSKGRYVIASLGGSRYQLDATKTGKEGEVTKISDKGTMVELRKKYPFLLRNFQFVSLQRPQGSLHVNPLTFIKRTPLVTALGLTLRRPSKDLEFHLKLPTETSWIVESVKPGSRGAELGLKKMDLLTHADGGDLSEARTIKLAKSSLAVVRRGKPMRVSLAVEKPAEK